MLITEDYVLLNLPKTGSTFARTVIKEILEKRQLDRFGALHKIFKRCGINPFPLYKEMMLPNIMLKGFKIYNNQHGTFSQIPHKYRNRSLVSIVRNPYSRLVSAYAYRAWEKRPPIQKILLEEHFPQFPDLSFDDYVLLNELELKYGRMGGKEPNANVGNQTVQFIQMFFKKPEDVLQNLTDAYLDSEEIYKDIADIHFLQQEKLHDDLASYLEGIGYTQDEVNYVRERDRVNVTNVKNNAFDAIWTPSAIEYVRDKERMIFRLLKSKGISYEMPEKLSNVA